MSGRRADHSAVDDLQRLFYELPHTSHSLSPWAAHLTRWCHVVTNLASWFDGGPRFGAVSTVSSVKSLSVVVTMTFWTGSGTVTPVLGSVARTVPPTLTLLIGFDEPSAKRTAVLGPNPRGRAAPASASRCRWASG